MGEPGEHAMGDGKLFVTPKDPLSYGDSHLELSSHAGSISAGPSTTRRHAGEETSANAHSVTVSASADGIVDVETP